MPSPRLLDHDEPVRVRVRGEDDEEPPEPDQLRRVRRERRVAAAHVEARDEHGPMCALSRHPARHRRHSIAYSLGTPHAIAATVSRTLSAPCTPSTRSFKDAGPARARIKARAHGGARHVQRADVPSMMRRRLERVEPAVPSCPGELFDACVRRALRHPSPFTPSTRRAVTLNNAEAFFPTQGPRRGTPRRDSRGPTRRIDRT